MQAILSRRSFVQAAGRAALACAAFPLLPRTLPAIEPFARTGGSRLFLSLAAYSFRDSFKADAARRIDMFQFIDYCAAQGCAGAELTSYYFPPDLTEEFLLKIRRHAFLRGVAISGTAVGNTFTLPAGPKRDAEIAGVKKWIDRAALLGAPHIRIFGGDAGRTPPDEAKKNCIQGIEECCEYAGRRGIFLGLENHGGIVAGPDGLLEIVRAVKSPWLGVNLDTGNFHTDDVYRDLALCAPYAVNVQLKAEVQQRGGKPEPADLARKVKILRDASYQGYVALEYESTESPWTAVPPLLKRMKELFAA